MIRTDRHERRVTRRGHDTSTQQFGVDDDARPVRLDRPRPQLDRLAVGVGRRNRTVISAVTQPGGPAAPVACIRWMAAAQFEWQSSSDPMIPPLRMSSKAAWWGSGCHVGHELARVRGRVTGPASKLAIRSP